MTTSEVRTICELVEAAPEELQPMVLATSFDILLDRIYKEQAEEFVVLAVQGIELKDKYNLNFALDVPKILHILHELDDNNLIQLVAASILMIVAEKKIHRDGEYRKQKAKQEAHNIVRKFSKVM